MTQEREKNILAINQLSLCFKTIQTDFNDLKNNVQRAAISMQKKQN